ncbi:iron-containing alcohol dehydrogenase [Spirochaetota bacterium]
MVQYNFPTIMLSGEGSLKAFCAYLEAKNHRKTLIVTDRVLNDLGIVENLTNLLSSCGMEYEIFTDTHPNPIEEDVEKGVDAYKKGNCDSIIGFGGGSPIDVAKVVKIMVSHEPPLRQYDDELGGDKLIVNPMPSLYAIPTTSGTGSEVGRSGVIIVKETGRKTIFFHPDLMPEVAVLEPMLTESMPPHLTAASGIDALVHCLEAYFVPSFHPMADGIALQGMELVLQWLPKAFKNGKDIDARSKMQVAASMGATAFQKGLGLIHSIAHPLSSMYDLHHGLANALALPDSVKFLENSDLDETGRKKISIVNDMLIKNGYTQKSLSQNLRSFIIDQGIEMGLSKYDIKSEDFDKIIGEILADPCHAGSMIPVTRDDFLEVIKKAY